MQKYRFKFYLNAVHSIEINGVMGQEHPHTWEIGIDALKSDDSFIMFTAIEKGVEQLLSVYQDKNMNKVPPFDTLNPTLENVSIYLRKVLEQFLIEKDWFLTRLEVSETPARTFIMEIQGDKEEKAGEEGARENWLKTVDLEVEKFIAKKTQRMSEGIEEQKVAAFPHEAVREFLKREKSRIKKHRFISFGIAGALLIGMLVLLVEKILLR